MRITTANSTEAIAALSDAPLIVWTLACRAPHSGPAPLDSAASLGPPMLVVGGAYCDAFFAASPNWQRAVEAAHSGVAQTLSTFDADYTFHAHYTPVRDTQNILCGARCVVTVIAREPAPPPAHVAPQPMVPAASLSHEDFADVLASAPVAISVIVQTGAKLVVAFANPSYEALMQQGALAGRNVAEVFASSALIDPRIMQTINHVARQGVRNLATREWRVAGLNGAADRYFDFVYEPLFDADNAPRGMSTFAYEVTSQVEARRVAQASQTRLQTLADSMPQIVWSADAHGEIQYYNKQWYLFTGHAPSDTSAQTRRELCHPDDLEALTQAFIQARTKQTLFSHEARTYDNKAQIYRWFLHRAAPLKDAQGQVVQWFGSSTDVDMQRREKEQVDSILESMNDAFFAVDDQWRVTRVNAKHIEVSQMPREAQLGKTIWELFFSAPGSENSIYWRSYRKAMKERVAVFFEDYYAPLKVWTDVNVYPAADGGLAVFFKDSTRERRLTADIEQEKLKFEAIFFDSPACMALLQGPDLVFEQVNRKYLELMGNRPLLGKTFDAGLPELVGKPFKQLMLNVLETGKTFIANEMAVYLIRREGSEPEETFFDFTYSRVEDGHGRPYGVYIHATDITEKVLVRSKAEKLAESLTHAVQARDEFLSIASHELKTPVTSLKMQLQMTRRAVKPDENKAPLPSKLAKTLDLCCRQIDRLTALIEDLLDVSRVESGKMTFNFGEVDLPKLLEEVVDRFAEPFRTAGCSIEMRFSENISIRCDGFRIEQVITNLLSNAIKYGAGTPVVITAQSTPEGARVTVRDEGMGIAKDKQCKVFDRFERAISHNNVSGLGLGLYISKQIVEAHHGVLSLESVLGCGSTFTLELPQDPSSPHLQLPAAS